MLLTMILSPILLIWDLGRPERFYNMLRILKLRSPMSTQSWSVFALRQPRGPDRRPPGRRRRPAREENSCSKLVMRLIPARLLSVLALCRSGSSSAFNTGNLITATSVPMWARNWLFMGPTFLTSGLSTGPLAPLARAPPRHRGEKKTLRALHRAEKATLVSRRSLSRLAGTDEPVEQAALLEEVAPLFVGGTLLGGDTRADGPPLRRESRSAGASSPPSLALLGGLAFRFAMIKGGKLSARDPQATFTFAKKENPSGYRLRG